jgi:hypothetical protein
MSFKAAASTHACAILAYELSDWVRLTDQALHPSEIGHLASIIDRLYLPALKEFFQNLSHSQGSIWDVISIRPALLQGYVIHNTMSRLASNVDL